MSQDIKNVNIDTGPRECGIKSENENRIYG